MAARARRVGCAALVAALLGAAAPAAAVQYSGTVTGKGLVFLGDFCFGYNPNDTPPAGKILGTITTQSNNVQLVTYDDQDNSWPAVYGNDACDCACMTSSTHAIQAQPVDPASGSGSGSSSGSGNAWPFYQEVEESIRPRWWYVALVSCDSEEFTATFDLKMEQWDGNQLGVNQYGMFDLYLVMFLLWGVAALGQAWASRWLWRARTFHPIIKLFTLSVWLWFLFTLCEMIHWAAFTGNGIGVPFLEGLGRVLEVFGRISFLLVMMLIAKGWTVSTTVLTERMQLLLATGLLLLVYLILAIWDLAGRDHASTVYVYDSAPGVIICLLHVIMCGWFVMRVLESYRNEKHTEKRRFFAMFGSFYCLWFLSLPLIVIIGAVAAPWVRQKTVESMVMACNSMWYGVLMWMLWPSRASQYFEIQTDQFVASTHQYEDL